MENSLADLENLGGVKKLYDLKGSLVHRFTKINSNKESPNLSNLQREKSLSQVEISSKEISLVRISQIRNSRPVVLKDQNFLESDDLFIEL